MDGDISIGAIGAALIAAVVSLLGLIISKEQKTSEFRQAWIDSLRAEITQYLTSFNAIADALRVTYNTQADKVAALSPLYSKLNESNFAITLRVNPDEERSRSLLSAMIRFKQLTANDADMVPAKIRPIELDFLSSSKELLKYEWNRVKGGEFTFKLTKAIAAAVIIGTIFALVILAGKKPKGDDTEKTGKANITNNVRHEVHQSPQCLSPAPSRSAGPSRPIRVIHARGHTSDRRAPISPVPPTSRQPQLTPSAAESDVATCGHAHID
jgi:hypothetical protein